MPDPHYECDAFISYSREDIEVALKIEARLKELCSNGSAACIFLDRSSIKPGDNFVDRINKGLSRARFYLLLLSPSSIKAEWPTAERDAALLSDPSGRGGRVVPVLVKDCEIPPLLAIRHWIDARDKSSFDAGMISLASKITGRALAHGAAGGVAGTFEGQASARVPIRPHSHEPDAVDEVLYANLYKVTKVPTIRSAPTVFSTKKAVFRELRCRLPAFIVRGGRLYTSSDIRSMDNALRSAIDASGIEDIPFEFWLESYDNKRILTELLNIHANHRCGGMGLSYDAIGKKYYGDKARVTSQKLQWLSHVRKGSRALILPYPSDGEARFYRHRAIKLSFRVLGSEVFLQMNPSWTFTDDGSAVIVDQKKRSSLNTRLRSYDDNDDEFTELRFWAWLLSKGGRIEMGERGNPVQVEYMPLRFASQAGIHGDHRPVRFDTNDPPKITLDAHERGASGSSGRQ